MSHLRKDPKYSEEKKTFNQKDFLRVELTLLSARVRTRYIVLV